MTGVQTCALPISYQWRKNGVNISGATSSTYTVSNAQLTHAGTYDVVASNLGGSATSAGATLSVNAPPSITAQPLGASVFVGQPASFAITATGTGPLAFQWKKDGSNLPGATAASYGIASCSLGDAGSYQAVVSSPLGSATSQVAVLTVTPAVPPAITSQPQPQSRTVGQSVSFSVSATGTAPLSYQWRKDGSNIPGATNLIYALSNIGTNAAGSYLVVVTNVGGVVTSSPPAILTVSEPIPGTVIAWGYDSEGQSSVPSGLQYATASAAGDRHSLALLSSGAVVAWGDNFHGQTSVPANAMSGVVAIAVGGNHSLALKQDRSLVAWGKNQFGQTTIQPTLQGALVAIAAGGDHSIAVTTNGQAVAWGWNDYGQTSIPSGLTNVRRVAAGLYHSVALRSDGSVLAWGATNAAGDNNHGQTIVPANGATNVMEIAAGGWHTVALKHDGTVVTWGKVFAGDAGMVPDIVPTGLKGVVAVAAGWNHTIALKKDGTAEAWGWNGQGQATIPIGLRNLVSVSGGWNHSLAVVGL